MARVAGNPLRREALRSIEQQLGRLEFLVLISDGERKRELRRELEAEKRRFVRGSAGRY